MNLAEIRKNTPCKTCRDRYAECHSNCERYKLWREQLNAAEKTYRHSGEDNWEFMGYLHRRYKRIADSQKRKAGR